MKILVTGGAGFIGSNIVDNYVRVGHEVTIIDNLYSGKRKNINHGAEFYEFDIRDKMTAELIRDKKFELISHHAAQMDVRKSVEDPAFDADVNIMGLINIMQAAASVKVRKVVFSSSGGTIYGECGDVPPDESASADPLSPYGISKMVSEYYLRYFSVVHGVKFTVLRYGNVYGPRQDPHGEAGVVAIFINKFLEGSDITIFGDGRQMRDYVFVEDVVDANMKALNTADDEVINIGTEKAVSVNELYKELKKVGGFKSKAVYKASRAGELFKSFLDTGKAKRVLGWQAGEDLSRGLEKTLEYFRERAAI